MHHVCPCPSVSYAAWRLQVLRRLCAGTDLPQSAQLSFLRSEKHPKAQRRQLHQSKSCARNNVKDVKRSAEYRVVQLELGKNHSPDANTSKSSTTKQAGEWTPYDEGSVEELQSLVSDLRRFAKNAAIAKQTEEEDIPFSASKRLTRRQRSPQSPLEHALPWERPKKAQAHEVEVDKKLENNVWAQMLASPLRMDRASKARLPISLMTSWGVVKNPKDGKDYLLPIETSDLEGFREELAKPQPSAKDEQTVVSDNGRRDLPAEKYVGGTRIQAQPNRLMIQALTTDFVIEKFNATSKTSQIISNSARINKDVIPFRWRHKASELDAFKRSRDAFNKALDRPPDADEVDVEKLADLERIQWQPDIVERIDKIMRERVLIAVEAVGRDNSSGRAVHDRRVVALPVPTDGQLYMDERGRVSSTPTKTEGSQEGTAPVAEATPDWIHGAVCLYVGDSSSYQNTIRRWQSQSQTRAKDGSQVEQLPTSDLIPPMITINEQYRLPVFNLEFLFGADHALRINETINANKIFDLTFWQQQNDHPRGFQTTSDSTMTHAQPQEESIMDMGDQVLSSIVTPKIDASLLQPSASDQNIPDRTSQCATESSPSAGEAGETVLSSIVTPESNATSAVNLQDEPYIVIIKPRARHAAAFTREIWQLWRWIGGKKVLSNGAE